MASSPRSRERVRPTQVQKRDPKGLYAKVAAGEIKSFTGMSADAPCGRAGARDARGAPAPRNSASPRGRRDRAR